MSPIIGRAGAVVAPPGAAGGPYVPAGAVVAPSGDTTGATDFANVQAAFTAQMPTAGTIWVKPGMYYFDAPLVVGPVGGAVPVAVPSLVAMNGSGRIGDLTDVSAVTFKATAAFPVGSFLLDYQQTAGTLYGPSGALNQGITLDCNARAAGFRAQGPRDFAQKQFNIINPHAPVTPGDGAAGGHNVTYITGAASAGAYNYFEQVCVTLAGQDGFYNSAPNQDDYVSCNALDNTRAQVHFTDRCIASWTGGQAVGGLYTFWMGRGTQAVVTGVTGWNSSPQPTSSAVLLDGTNTIFGITFVGCNFANAPAAAPGEEAGSMVAVRFNNTYPQNAVFNACSFAAGTNTTDYVYVEASVTGTVRFNGCNFTGAITNVAANDTSGNRVLSFNNCTGIIASRAGTVVLVGPSSLALPATTLTTVITTPTLGVGTWFISAHITLLTTTTGAIVDVGVQPSSGTTTSFLPGTLNYVPESVDVLVANVPYPLHFTAIAVVTVPGTIRLFAYPAAGAVGMQANALSTNLAQATATKLDFFPISV